VRVETGTKRIIVLGLVLLIAVAAHSLQVFRPFFIDEAAILQNILTFLSKMTLIPSHTAYPTFYSYVAVIPFTVGAVVGYVLDGGDNIQEYVAKAYLISPIDLTIGIRVGSFALLLLTAAAIMKIARLTYAKYSSHAALFIVATPALMDYGSFALPDILVLFLATACYLKTRQYLEPHLDPPEQQRYLLQAAFLAGLAVSTKYNAISLLVLPPLAFALKTRPRVLELRSYAFPIKLAFVALLAFLLGSPGWVVEPQLMWDGLAREIHHAAVGHLGATGLPVIGYLELLTRRDVVLFCSAVGLFWISFKRGMSAETVLCLSLIILGFVVTATSSKQSFHYLYPSVPAFVTAGILLLKDIEQRELRDFRRIVYVLLLIYASISLFQSRYYLRPNTTELAAKWISANLSPTATGYTGVAIDFAYVPLRTDEYLEQTARSSLGRRFPGVIRALRLRQRDIRVVPIEYSGDFLAKFDGSYIITSSGCFARFFRGGFFTEIRPKEGALRDEFDLRKEFYATLFGSRRWRLIRSFETGNGPRTVIFQREASASGAVLPSEGMSRHDRE
jgi:hypothetical protein